jgi:hypothetical protein
MKKLKNFVWQSLNKLELGGLVQLHIKSALTEIGWFRSYHTKQSVDKDGRPIPWCTYPFIHFIEPRLHKQMDVFEFGCGNSTLWYASRVKNVKSVEHDRNWVKLMQAKLPSNAKVVFQELEDGSMYTKEVSQEGKKYHIIIVDGRKRNRSAQEAVNNLSEDGVIVWDNSNLPHYQTGVSNLMKSDFRRIDFWGLSPITAHLNCTTIFYKTQNCLGI